MPCRFATSRLFLLLAIYSLPGFGLRAKEVEKDTQRSEWAYGAYLDLSYADALNGTQQNYPWRSKLTTTHLNAFEPNMAMAYVIKNPSESSRWGMEFGVQAGADVQGQIPKDYADPLPGAHGLAQLSRANVSYLAPIGNGLTFKAGLMHSFIGFESLYAGKNPNYTRTYIADYSPYFLIGAGGEYAFSQTFSTAFFLVTDYNYLAFTGHQPKYAGQFKWAFEPGWSYNQSYFFGPQQADNALAYWRGFSDSVLTYEKDNWLIAMAYDVGTEKRQTDGVQTLWMGSAIWTRWHIGGPWTVAIRPEVYWDPNGELTGAEQWIAALTATAEVKLPIDGSATLLRAEYRHDTSTGPQGGFYNPNRDALQAGNLLVPNQNLFFFALIWNYDHQGQ